ncbi:MAG: hypothetical protein ACW987_10625 [Candidatus Thorarchaeota archaeon]|jgi:hypothetical protein
MLFIDKIKERASKRNTLIFLIIAVVSFVLMGAVIMAMMDQSGILAFLDMRFFYTFDDVTEYLTALGETGRTYYLYQKIVDSFFPIGYGLGIALALGYLCKKSDIKNPWHSIILIPIIAAIFDYIENILLTTQIVSFPTISETIVSVAAITTLIKWIFLLSAIGVLFVSVLLFAVKRRTSD